MGITRVQLINWTGGGHKYKKVFRVETDDPNIGPRTIELYFRNELGLFRGVQYSHGSGDTAESDVASFAQYPSIEPFAANRLNWTVTFDYSEAEEQQQEEENPLDEPPDFSRFSQSREEVIERDIHGKPIRNSAYDRYDEIITRDAHRTVLRVVKNFAQWPQSNYRFMNTVNRLDMRIDDEVYRPRQVRILNMSDARQYSEVLKSDSNPRGLYFQATIELAFAEDDWQVNLLDQGVRQRFRRWRVAYFNNVADTTVRYAVIRAESEDEAAAFADNNYVNWINLREIASGYEPVRETPPPEIGLDGLPKTATGATTKLPMLLDGKGRQQGFNGVPVWLQYQGYFESDFAFLALS